MAGLTLTLEVGDSAVVEVPLVDDNGEETTELIVVHCVRVTRGRCSVAIEAPRDFIIKREPRRSAG